MMMLAAVSLILFLSLIEVHSQSFPYVSFMNKTLANSSYVNFSLVDDGSDSVQCHTDNRKAAVVSGLRVWRKRLSLGTLRCAFKG